METVTVQPGETLPTPRCERCDKPGEWSVSYAGHDRLRKPPWRFWSVTYCDEHLPEDGRAAIPEWVTDEAH